jgi:hypothetical protein
VVETAGFASRPCGCDDRGFLLAIARLTLGVYDKARATVLAGEGYRQTPPPKALLGSVIRATQGQ